MWRNIILTAIRNLMRQKVYSFINIAGFSVGLAVTLILSFYVYNDLSFDRFHRDTDRIFRVLTVDSSENEALSYSITAGPLIEGIPENVPEVEAATRITVGRPNISLPDSDKEPIGVNSVVADVSFFKVFSFEILSGNKETPLQNLQGIYLTEELAAQLFEDDEPLNKPVRLNRRDCFVAGIVRKNPTNSHINYDVIVPLDISVNPVWWNSWENLALIGYAKLKQGTDVQAVESKINQYARAAGFAEVFVAKLQPLKDIHLKSTHLNYDFINNERSDYLKVLSMGLIAIMVMLVAIINYINLSSARAIKRAKEVGMRKVIGGTRKQLMFQFQTESLLVTFIAMLIALLIFEICLPFLNDFLGRTITFNVFKDFRVLGMLFLTSLIIGLIAGFYPAMILSSFSPIMVLKGKFSSGKKGSLLRKILVISQFSISIALLTAVFIILQQVKFLNNIDLGYNRQDMLIINNQHFDQGLVIRDKLLTMPDVKSVSSIDALPGATPVRLEVVPEGHFEEKGYMFDRYIVDSNFLKTFEIKLLKGRDFIDDSQAEVIGSVLINEAAVRKLGWEDPIGKKLALIDENENRLERTIVGVISDVSYSSVKSKVNPQVIILSGGFYFSFATKIKGENKPETVNKIRAAYNELFPDEPLNFEYLDNYYNFQFAGDRVFAVNIAVFSGLAVFIACLGLFGLASYEIEHRRRELAVRKILGSSVKKLIFLLMKDFTGLVLIANLIGWVVSYFYMNKWLLNFQFRTSLNPLIFILSGLIAVMIAALTIIGQASRAANQNPIEAIKYE